MVTVIVACQTAATDGDTTSTATPAPSPAPPSSAPTMTKDVQLTVDRTSYESGADIRMTITNKSARDLGYNPCTRIVERESGASWRQVPEPDRVCTMELRLLAKGETVTEATDLPKLAEGRYRVALVMSDEGGSQGGPVRAVSAAFQVR